MERELLVMVEFSNVSSSDQAKNVRDALRRELGVGADTRTLQCLKGDMKRGLIPGAAFTVNRTAGEVDNALRVVLRCFRGISAEVCQFEQIGVGIVKAYPAPAPVAVVANLGAFAGDGVLEPGSSGNGEGTGNPSGGPEVGDPKPPADGTIQCAPLRLPEDPDDPSDDHAGGGAE